MNFSLLIKGGSLKVFRDKKLYHEHGGASVVVAIPFSPNTCPLESVVTGETGSFFLSEFLPVWLFVLIKIFAFRKKLLPFDSQGLTPKPGFELNWNL